MNNKVTIDADYFAELWYKAKQAGDCDNCEVKFGLQQAIKERDELKTKLEDERNSKCDEQTLNRLAAAERCIEEIEKIVEPYGEHVGNYIPICDIIRAWREKRDAKEGGVR